MRLKELRDEKKLSQEEVAKAIGTSQTNIGRWEKGLNEPSSGFVIKLANYFEVSIDYLLGREDDFGNITVTSSPSSDLSASSPNVSLTPEEKELLTLFRSLPNIRRKTVMDSIRFMSESPETAENPRKEKRYGSK